MSEGGRSRAAGEPVGRASLSEYGRDPLRAVISGKGRELCQLMWGGGVGGGGGGGGGGLVGRHGRGRGVGASQVSSCRLGGVLRGVCGHPLTRSWGSRSLSDIILVGIRHTHTHANTNTLLSVHSNTSLNSVYHCV